MALLALAAVGRVVVDEDEVEDELDGGGEVVLVVVVEEAVELQAARAMPSTATLSAAARVATGALRHLEP